jgi:ubiquinone/menaquinone biosynthesis C-methylase UbiE
LSEICDPVFKDSMPQFYDTYLGPITFAPFAADIAQRVKILKPERVLEIACGTGIVTYAIADVLPAGTAIVATDLSPSMIDFAKAKRPEAEIIWRQADAQKLPFTDISFDLVVCQFGVMFLPDKPSAFREARRVLVPGGCLIFTVWDSLEANELQRTNADAISALFPENPPTFIRRVPFGYHDRTTIAEQLRDAGFGEIRIEAIAKSMQVPSARHYAVGGCLGGPLLDEIERRDRDGIDRATDAVARAIERRFGPGAFAVEGRALVVTASVPEP